MKKHAILSASSAHRWVRCPASVLECKDILDTTNSFAEEGTLAHELAEKFLRGEAYDNSRYTEEMIKHAEDYKAYVQTMTSDGDKVLVEQLVDYSCVTAVRKIDGEVDSFGTADCIIIGPDTVTVIDYKYGQGIRVDAEENLQMILYGLGSLTPSTKKLKLCIFQPRLDHVSEWEVNPRSLSDIEIDIYAAAQAVAKKKPVYEAGEHCRYCKIAGSCKVREKYIGDTMFDDAEEFKSVAMDQDEIEKVLLRLDDVEDWVKAVRLEAYARALNGVDFKLFKLVTGKSGNREWADESVVKERLGKDAVKEVVLSPTELKNYLPRKLNPEIWADLDKQVTRSEGKPTLVPVSDKRQKLIVNRDDDFGRL